MASRTASKDIITLNGSAAIVIKFFANRCAMGRQTAVPSLSPMLHLGGANGPARGAPWAVRTATARRAATAAFSRRRADCLESPGVVQVLETASYRNVGKGFVQ
ncbi:uncharacterized protein LOC123448276 isoform X2 [Hordeum vulgare subsp. vulgare]|uniref:uncharacterized protein LOC123448276 isoform X2 n=1 Tax=Hordeum vulgare subsp. vulgare TaxID=112509 RepID=UPI001D1A3BAC|nr:uncharacterized protein LOC123448276 isoform X2 [Hordeum vulgare subsp. vulgare]